MLDKFSLHMVYYYCQQNLAIINKGELTMEREEILAKAQKENKGLDTADLDAQRKGAYIAYFVGVIFIIIADIINGIIFKNVNHGPNAAVCAMAFTAFITKYFYLKKKHELIVALCYLAVTLLFTVLWILQLCGVI